MNTVENLRKWMRSCPAISNMDSFGVDFMGQDPTQFAIYTSPSAIATQTDILGNVYPLPTQELNYTFVSLFAFSKNILQNLENLGFFTQLLEWIYRQNAIKNFPQIAEGRVLSIMPTLSPYVFDADSDSGRYQIQIKVRYRRK